LNARPGATVASLACNFGFFDLGRFASAYRNLFDEPPSATLAKSTRQNACRDLRTATIAPGTIRSAPLRRAL
jgi:hypothetical protein